jgi:O-phosphoseryl-tRNA(Cys) synthetase
MFATVSECQQRLRLCFTWHVDRAFRTMQFKTNALDLSVDSASCTIENETEINVHKTFLG